MSPPSLPPSLPLCVCVPANLVNLFADLLDGVGDEALFIPGEVEGGQAARVCVCVWGGGARVRSNIIQNVMFTGCIWPGIWLFLRIMQIWCGMLMLNNLNNAEC